MRLTPYQRVLLRAAEELAKYFRTLRIENKVTVRHRCRHFIWCERSMRRFLAARNLARHDQSALDPRSLNTERAPRIVKQILDEMVLPEEVAEALRDVVFFRERFVYPGLKK